MRSKNSILIILVSILIVLFITIIVILLNTNYFSNSNKNLDKETNANKQEQVENTNKGSNSEKEDSKQEINNNSTPKEENDNKQNSNISNDESTSDKKEDSNASGEDVEYTEKDVISYFSLKEKEISNNQEDKSLRKTVKDSFVTIVDFIFYDKEIKGYTFDELTTSAKLKVIEIALSIDNKIDEYFPDYKETIKDKYTDIKGKLAVKYLEFTETLCDKVGSDVCNQAKEDFNTMKESFGFTWELIKELAKSGSSKVKEFYESWRDSE